MRARWIVNLVLLLLVAALGLAIRSELSGQGGPQTLAGIDPADLRRIEVEREGEPRIRLERGPQGWRMLEPMSVDANQDHVGKLLEIIAAPVERSFPEQAAALAELGLAPAKLTLKLDSLTLAFGGLDPLGQRRYVAADGLVHLIEDRFYHLLIAPPIDYVARAPLPAGQPPAFATLSGVPLATGSVKALETLRTERLEPLGTDLAGEPLQVKFADGSALRFLVSEDRRRWSRLDLKLRYVLADPPLLELDPTAIDPTPPEPPPAPADTPQRVPTPLPMPTDNLGPEDLMDLETMGPEPGYAPPLEPDPADPFAPIPDSETPVSEGETPPEVRLSPQSPGGRGGYSGQGPDEEFGGGFGGEPDKEPPQGFGMDPFAPDPAYDPDLAPDEP